MIILVIKESYEDAKIMLGVSHLVTPYAIAFAIKLFGMEISPMLL